MVRREQDGPVLRLVLDRPEVGNAFDAAVIDGLEAGIAAAERDDAVRVVVLAGAGKHFSAGADLAYMSRMRDADREANEADALRTQAIFARVAACPKPVVARVHGAARGGGVGLVAVADVVVASDAATFAFTEVRLGIIPAMISPFVIERLGPARARRLFLTAETFGAADAAAWGLVDVVATSEALDDAVARVVGRLVRGGPIALAEAKRLVHDVAEADPAAIGRLTSARIAALRVSEEGQEGMAAFLEKRPPRWVP
jgi:methylglutaconyl-CoA hydratase